MNVSCPDCRSIFRVDPAKVPPVGVRARCSVCSGVIPIPAPNAAAAAAPAAPARQGSPGVARAGEPQTPPRPSAPTPRPVEAGGTRPRAESIDRPTASATATPPSPSGGMPEFSTPTPPPFVPPVAPPPFVPPVAPPPFVPAAPATASNVPPFVPPAPRGVAPPRPAAPTPPREAPSGDSGARRPVNPFLSKDPNQRAKRLARALVSDIITYHPAKHAEGLRDGTLKQLFREEIKKSFEEYIAQVGQPLAESTTYFQEALNEVLGAGKKIF